MVELRFLELGLIPPEMDLKSSLRALDPDDARKSKRKFRKLHRKIKSDRKKKAVARVTRRGYRKITGRMGSIVGREGREHQSEKIVENLDAELGYVGTDPNLRQNNARKMSVERHISNEIWESLDWDLGIHDDGLLENQ
jgi:hypothetical protein